MFNFGAKVEEKSNDLIPKDTLLFMRITVRGVKNSKETNGQYVDMELTVAENQPYAGRKIWCNLSDPFDQLNSQEGRDRGMGMVRRILEGVYGARPDNPASYNLPNWEALQSQHLVPVCVGIQKAKAGSGYEDKNSIAEFLSPHSSIKKVVECFNLLKSGQHTYVKAGTAAPAAQGTMPGFGMTPAAAPAQVPAGFGAPAAAAPAGNAPGWLNSTPAPAGNAPAPQATQAPQATMAPPGQTAPATAYPSNPPAAAPVGYVEQPPMQAHVPPAQVHQPVQQPGFQQPAQPTAMVAAGAPMAGTYAAPATHVSAEAPPATPGFTAGVATTAQTAPSDQPWNNGANPPAQFPNGQ